MVAVFVKYSCKAQQQQWEQIKRIKTQLKRSHPNNTVNNCTFCFKIKHKTKPTKPTKLTSLVMSSLLGVFLVSLCLRNTQWMLPSPLMWHRHGRSPRANRGGSLEESNAERRLLVRKKAAPLPVLAQKIMLEGIIMERKKKKSSLTGRECGYLWSAHILGGFFCLFVCLSLCVRAARWIWLYRCRILVSPCCLDDELYLRSCLDFLHGWRIHSAGGSVSLPGLGQ